MYIFLKQELPLLQNLECVYISSSSPPCHFVDLSIFNFLHIINLQGIALPEFNERKQFTMKTKRFKNLCPHTNSEMEISVLYQEVPMTGTLTQTFQKS